MFMVVKEVSTEIDLLPHAQRTEHGGMGATVPEL